MKQIFKKHKEKFVFSLILILSGLAGIVNPEKHPFFDFRVTLQGEDPKYILQRQTEFESMLQARDDTANQSIEIEGLESLPPEEANKIRNDFASGKFFDPIIEMKERVTTVISKANRFSLGMGVLQLLLAATIMVATFFSEKRKKLDKKLSKKIKKMR